MGEGFILVTRIGDGVLVYGENQTDHYLILCVISAENRRHPSFSFPDEKEEKKENWSFSVMVGRVFFLLVIPR